MKLDFVQAQEPIRVKGLHLSTTAKRSEGTDIEVVTRDVGGIRYPFVQVTTRHESALIPLSSVGTIRESKKEEPKPGGRRSRKTG